MILLSVIVPMYNAESTLLRVLNSVTAQQVPDMELILVNDGSTDSTLSLCEQFALTAPFKTQIINKENGGSRDARNAGLDAAQGKYVTFVDADDHLAANTYNENLRILQTHPTIDLLEYPIFEYMNANDFIIHNRHPLELKDEKGVAREWLNTLGFYNSYSCNKIYRRSIFHTLRFSGGRDFDDFHTMPHIMALTKHYYCSPNGEYHYRTSSTSLSHYITEQRAERVVQSIRQMLETITEHGLPISSLAYRKIRTDLLNKLILLNYINPKNRLIEQESVLLNNRKNRSFKFQGLSPKEKIKNCCLNLFGASFTIQVFSHLFKSPPQYNVIRK